jgi:hypothetical protein
MLPVNLGMILFYGYTTWYLMKNISSKRNLVFYSIVILAISGIYINADDNFKIRKYNSCEREALKKIANSTERVVFIDSDCNVFDWDKLKKPRDSRYKAELLYYWNVIKEQKLYYQK